jgi:hypothetical protein
MWRSESVWKGAMPEESSWFPPISSRSWHSLRHAKTKTPLKLWHVSVGHHQHVEQMRPSRHLRSLTPGFETSQPNPSSEDEKTTCQSGRRLSLHARRIRTAYCDVRVVATSRRRPGATIAWSASWT